MAVGALWRCSTYLHMLFDGWIAEALPALSTRIRENFRKDLKQGLIGTLDYVNTQGMDSGERDNLSGYTRLTI